MGWNAFGTTEQFIQQNQDPAKWGANLPDFWTSLQ